MVFAKTLAAGLISLGALPLSPLASAQTATPRAKSVTVMSAMSRSYLGIGVLDVSDERAKALGLKDARGAEVTSVADDSPAAKAGLKPGDVILEYNGQPVEGNQQFVRMVQETPAGRKAVMQVWRNKTRQAITAVIGSRRDRGFMLGVPTPPEPPNVMIPDIQIPDLPREMMSWRSPVLGIDSESLNSQLADFFGVKEGVLVRFVLKGSAAETAGLKAGDVITKIDGQPVTSPRNITNLLRKSGKDVSITLVRNHKELTLNVKLAELMRPSDLESRDVL